MADLTDDAARFAYLAEGNAKQARKRVAADVLLRDELNKILLVNPTYKDYWDLPGGMVENNESPRQAVVRELGEELGVDVVPGRVLAVDWISAHGPWDDQLAFIFDGGILDSARIKRIRVVDAEISEFMFADYSEAVNRLRPDMAERLQRAMESLGGSEFPYSETEVR